MKWIYFCLMASWLPALSASDQVPAKAQTNPIALTEVTLYPISGVPIENAVILFENGKITAMGTQVDLPAGTQITQLAGHSVYPGFVETSSRLGLVEVNAVRATRDFAETGKINPNVRAEVAVNPDSELIPVARSNGLTIAVTMPSGGIISGRAAAIMLDGWTSEEMTLKAPLAMMVQWPRMAAFDSPFIRRSVEEQEKDIAKNLAELETAFRDARAYYLAAGSAKKAGRPGPVTDLRWEAMMPVFEGTMPLWIVANSVKQIHAAIDFTTRENLRMVLVGGAAASEASLWLKERNIPVIIQKTLRLPNRRDADYDQAFTLPARLAKAGITFCIAANSGFGNDRNLPYQAAMAAAFGLDREEALKAITLYPAQIMGIDDRVGSLEVGKDATLIVTDGDPLEITTHVKHMFIQGRKVDLTNKQSMLYKKYGQRYSR